MLSTTTLTSIHNAIAAAIESVSPVERTAYPFIRVDKMSNVPGSGFRNFFVELSPPQPVDDGIHGTGVEVEASMDVYMNYSNLSEENDTGLVWSDGHELWIQLNRQIHPTITGLISVRHLGWRDESDEPGRLWGSHEYTVRFYARGLLS